MKNKIKKIAASIAAVSIMGTVSLSVSAATAGDVMGTAIGAGLEDQYVQILQNFLNTNKYTPEQYDVMVDYLNSVGDQINQVARDFFDIEEPTKSGDDTTKNDNFDDTFMKDIVSKMPDSNIVDILDELVEAGKKLDLDISFEKKADKNYIVTVKDKDGNVQLVTPVGKLIDTTGAAANNTTNNAAVASVAVAAVGCVGAIALIAKAKKNEE